MSLPNVWHLRRVADTASKACTICYKPSTSVLITPDNKDFFYVCPAHLKDRGFCSPIVGDAGEEAKKKRDEELAREIENVKREYEEKQKRKKEKEKKQQEKGKEKKADDNKDDKNSKEEDKKGEKEDDKNAEQEKNAKIEQLKKDAEPKSDDSPRIFALHKNFYQMRINRIRSIDLTKRNAERLKDPASFPSVPKGDLQ